MKVIFSHKRIEAQFSDFAKMQKEIGAKRTKLVKAQYNRMLAIRTFGEFLKLGLGKPHALVGNYSGYYGVHVDAQFRLIVKPIVDCETKIEMCEIICIEKLEDYHV